MPNADKANARRLERESIWRAVTISPVMPCVCICLQTNEIFPFDFLILAFSYIPAKLNRPVALVELGKIHPMNGNQEWDLQRDNLDRILYYL